MPPALETLPWASEAEAGAKVEASKRSDQLLDEQLLDASSTSRRGTYLEIIYGRFIITYLPLGRLIGSFLVFFCMFIAVLRSGRCFKGFLEGVASFSPSMSPWGATGTPFMTIFFFFQISDTHVASKLSDFNRKDNLLHMDA